MHLLPDQLTQNRSVSQKKTSLIQRQLHFTMQLRTAMANFSRTQSTVCYPYSLSTQCVRKRLHLLDLSPILLQRPGPHTTCTLALPRLLSVVSQMVPQEEIHEQNNLLQCLFPGAALKHTKFGTFYSGHSFSIIPRKLCTLKLPYDMPQGIQHKLFTHAVIKPRSCNPCTVWDKSVHTN